jgi:hypothetical protein
MVMAHHAQTLKYGGLLDHHTGKALATLARSYPVTFKAHLGKKCPTLGRSTSNDCRPLQITLYGLRQDSNAVGTLLSENKLYIQHPNTSESSVVYFNPQYLLRPGSQIKMPVPEDFQSCVREKQMVHAVKSQMLRVFDAAVGPAIFSEVQVSKRLTTVLKSYVNRRAPLYAFFTFHCLFIPGIRGKLWP